MILEKDSEKNFWVPKNWGLFRENVRNFFKADFLGKLLGAQDGKCGEGGGGFFRENIRKVRVRKLYFLKDKEFFFRVDIFYFLGLRLKGSVSQKTRKFFTVPFPEIWGIFWGVSVS